MRLSQSEVLLDLKLRSLKKKKKMKTVLENGWWLQTPFFLPVDVGGFKQPSFTEDKSITDRTPQENVSKKLDTFGSSTSGGIVDHFKVCLVEAENKRLKKELEKVKKDLARLGTIKKENTDSVRFENILFFLNPFLNKPWFLRVCRASLLKTLGKGEIARDKQFLLFPQCFLPIWRTFYHFHQIY